MCFDGSSSNARDVRRGLEKNEVCETADGILEWCNIGIDQFQPGSGHGRFGSYGSETGNGIAHHSLLINLQAVSVLQFHMFC